MKEEIHNEKTRSSLNKRKRIIICRLSFFLVLKNANLL
jgi:hypothetical protein